MIVVVVRVFVGTSFRKFFLSFLWFFGRVLTTRNLQVYGPITKLTNYGQSLTENAIIKWVSKVNYLFWPNLLCSCIISLEPVLPCTSLPCHQFYVDRPQKIFIFRPSTPIPNHQRSSQTPRKRRPPHPSRTAQRIRTKLPPRPNPVRSECSSRLCRLRPS